VQRECKGYYDSGDYEKASEELARYCVKHKMRDRDIKFMCTEAIGKMLDEMNQGLEKLAKEPYEKIRVHELKTRELKEGDFGINI